MTIVTCQGGAVRGSFENEVHAFKGIPYAEPIGGRARWLPPVARLPWQGVRDAQQFGPICPSFAARSVLSVPGARRQYLRAITAVESPPEGEDSLLLNVWTPSVDERAKLPVMVYIHGGGFTAGAANAFYDATRFARKGVVAVVIQYRLGPPGFLHGSGLFDGEFCADNRAFLDQLCALHWVQQNIASFGGDPSCVTVFGESAGAFSVYQLAASPKAKGLFQRAIAMGGMAQTCAPAAEYHQATRDALADVGVAAGDANALTGLDKSQTQALQAAVSKRIFRSSEDTYGSLTRQRIGFLGAATGTEFLPQSPLDAYASGTANKIELMLGTCANDGGLFSFLLPIGGALSAKLFSKQLLGLVPNRDMEAVRRHYRAQMPRASHRRVLEQINNDAFYREPTIAVAKAHAVDQPGTTYLYQLDYPSAIKGLGAIHGIDVALLFRNPPSGLLLDDDEQTLKLSELMLEAWTQFAKTGKPAATGLPAWAPFDAEHRITMVFDRVSKPVSDLDANLLRLWR